MNIERVLFWFKDGCDMLTDFNEDFFALATLLNRLLNEKYDGNKIKFINFDFATERTYSLFPKLPKDEAYYYGGHLRYYGMFDRKQFEKVNKIEQNKYVWSKAFEYLSKSAHFINNKKLLHSAEYAYQKGMEINLNPDYKMVEAELSFSGQKLNASVWVNFKEDGMYSRLTLEKDGAVVFEKDLDKTDKGIEFFLKMYKAIELQNNDLVIIGHNDTYQLPLKVPLDQLIL